jgi:leucyl aminopeptidase (aminopeptidase T)
MGAVDPEIINLRVAAPKAKERMVLNVPDPAEHRAENRATPPVDTRTDRRKYVIPEGDVAKIIAACRRGASETQIARALGVNYRTWMRVRAEDERIASVLAETRKVEEDELVSLLMDKARGGDTTALIFALKGRHGYRDNGNPQGTGDPKVNVTINLPAAQPSVEAYVAALNVEGDR